MRTLVGITGGIGTGKSAVSNLLASYCNKPLIDLDMTCRQLLIKDAPGWLALRDSFGRQFFTDNGELDRPLLRHHLFTDEQLKEKVDTLLHPLARKAMHQEVEELQQDLVFVEIPLLYEAGWEKDVEKVIVVSASADTQYTRIMNRDGVSRTQAEEAVKSQMDLGLKREKADFVVDNNNEWHLTRKIVITIAEQLEKAGFF